MTLDQRTTFISILGAPNAGKSTLTNAFVGEKISIVTPKVQTTRTQIRGICMHGSAQLIFIDTPGIFHPKKPLEKYIVQSAWKVLDTVDRHLFLIDATKGITEETRMILRALHKQSLPVVLVLNKIDRIDKNALLSLTEELSELYPFERVFTISALHRQGIEELMTFLAEQAPLFPWAYPEEDLTTASSRFIASELTREQIFFHLQEELPYEVNVLTESWKENHKGELVIHQIIQVNKEGQKQIVVGKNGSTLKAIGTKARERIERLTSQKVHLFLHVSVKPKWFLNNDYIEGII